MAAKNILQTTHKEIDRDGIPTTSASLSTSENILDTGENEKQPKSRGLYKEGHKRLMYSPPFFEIISKTADNITVTIRCYTCGELKTTKFQNTWSLKHHLRRHHPDICKKYDEYKNLFAYSSEYGQDLENSEKYIISKYKSEVQDKIKNDTHDMRDDDCRKKAQNEIRDDNPASGTVMEKLLFTPPFLEIVNINTNTNKYTTRCYTCGKLLTTGLNRYAPNLIIHLKLIHPLIYKIYDKCNKLDVYPNAECNLSSTPEEMLSLLEKYEKHPNSIPYKYVRLQLLYSPPFFEIISKSADYSKLTTRCCTCGVLESVNYLRQHLQLHSNLFEIYDKYKRLLIYSCKVEKLQDNSQNDIDEMQQMVPEIDLKETYDEQTENISESYDKPLKLIFKSPFYEIIHQSADNTRLTLRCCTCGGHRRATIFNTNGIKDHLKSYHPDIFAIYEGKQHMNFLNKREADIFADNSEKYIISEYEKDIQDKIENNIHGMQHKDDGTSNSSNNVDCELLATPKETVQLSEKISSFGTVKEKLMYSPPFYKIVHVNENARKFFVRCYTCKKLLSATLNHIAQNLKTHLQRVHPLICQLYDTCNKLSVYPNTILDTSSTPEDMISQLEKYQKKPNSRLCNNTTLNLLFAPPFFKIISKPFDISNLTVRCYTCGKLIETKSANRKSMQLHLKRLHPDIYKIYDKYKILLIFSIDDKEMQHKNELPQNNKQLGIDYYKRQKVNKNSPNKTQNKINEDIPPYDNSTSLNKFRRSNAIRDNIIKNKNKILEDNHEQRKTNSIKLRKKKFLMSQFFKLVHQSVNGKRIVRCYTCGKFMNTYSTFSTTRLKQHIQRHHPDKYKLYEKNKYKQYYSTSDTNACTNKYENIDFEFSDSNVKTVEEIIDQSLKNLVKETGYFQLKEKIMKIETENIKEKNSHVLELKSELENVKKECIQLRLALRQSKVSEKKLRNNLEELDNLVHERKLIIKNIKISNKNKPLKDIAHFFKYKLNLDKVEIINCVTITGRKISKNSNTETVLVELLKAEDCNLVLNQIYKLKNTGIIIEPELSSQQRKYRNKLMVLRKELLTRKPDLKVILHRLSLVVNGKHFYWDENEGICHDCSSTEAIEISGTDYLNTLTGLNLTEIVNILQKYEIKPF